MAIVHHQLELNRVKLVKDLEHDLPLVTAMATSSRCSSTFG